MDNPASPTSLANRGYTGPADVTVQQTRLDEAWRALQLELPLLVGWVAAGHLTAEAVADVVSAAALRVLRNPEGHTEGSGAIDDWRESWKLADSTEDLYFTAAELRRLSAAVPAAPTAGSFKYS